LETADGKFVFESNAILRHIARGAQSKGLYGSNDYETTLVDQWLDWTASELVSPLFQSVFPYLGHGTKQSAQEANKKLEPLLKILDDHFKINTYIVGNQVTIADISLAAYVWVPFRFTWDEKARKNIPNLSRWFENLASQEPFTKEFGRFWFCQKSLEVPHVPQAQEEKKENKKVEKKPEPKKEEKKPEAKKEDKKKKDDDDEDDAPVEKKEKNPLDSLPPSTFNLFDFKTLFVNSADKKEAVQFFFNNFDAAGYSIYQIEYIKAEGEGEKVYLTNNLMNGFIQRLEHFRKYAFGIHGVYGEEPVLEIKGVWVWRGVGLPHEITDLDSYEYHKFTKLELTNDADKAKVLAYWTGMNEDEDIVDGLRARTVKYFK
jgi:elongation factor 1-gamma